MAFTETRLCEFEFVMASSYVRWPLKIVGHGTSFVSLSLKYYFFGPQYIFCEF
jgi:hypothetical protein